MRLRLKHWLSISALYLVMAISQTANAVSLTPSDLVVADQFARSSILVDPATGAQMRFSFANLPGHITDIAIDASGDLVVAN